MSSFKKFQKNKGPPEKLTPQQKKEKKNDFYSSMADTSTKKAVSNAPYIYMHEASVEKLKCEVDKDGDMHVLYNYGTEAKPLFEEEKYFLIGKLFSMSKGIGERYVEESKKKDPVDPAKAYNEFRKRAQICLGMPFMESTLKACPTATLEMEKASEYWKKRGEFVFQQAYNNPRAFVTLKTTCENAVEDINNKQIEQGKDELTPEQRKAEYDTQFLLNFKIGTKIERYTEVKKKDANNNDVGGDYQQMSDEDAKKVAGKTHSVLMFNIKEFAFGEDFYKRGVPPEVKMEQQKPTAENKENMVFITAALAAGKVPQKWQVENDDGTIREYDLFGPAPLRCGSEVMVPIKIKSHQKGFSVSCGRFKPIYEPVFHYSKLELDVDRYKLPTPRTPHEISVLTLLKDNADKEDGVSSLDLTSMIKMKNIMNTTQLAAALVVLKTERLVVNGKDETHFKLRKRDLDIASLPLKDVPLIPADDKPIVQKEKKQKMSADEEDD